MNVKAENQYSEPFLIESTAYCLEGITKSGCMAKEGIIAGKDEWLGKTAILYECTDEGKLGDYIGIYEFKDTGRSKKIKNGTCIDIYIPSYDECIKWGRKNVFIQIIEAVG